ncbi:MULTISPECIES: 16S rRNA (guanine(966)-N(2))-methyltransferase RsmD [Pseudothermotoga]|jgi:16S rRNA (guanine(966)-N(2))-methyltransferase RsmD|uniref:Putative methyltransferase n=1 Tax=Pseudothermotoga lettingae (strain ATCC BAA-301 / DSM 14385 / NBRC 107922 / TMO) TaxID=416591 RepID=A8F385_PSELT|nr:MULTISPECIES: 16S rRNA (guanine(966)-N(2))-methyltransferase RsmD [Pseudothermotoga]ABV32619.1 putative methyltransferase [Pseudothermotoga lettingae TMO]KUK21607.1 MAG: Putative methyltransferase [Pseudothermotoga lettingae]MDI3495229.1 rRNA (guanine966-N2)-methyltransferase [Pseudothermotoga sp.]MDK2885121.1 rRNA (guanine966-N2)-methyltransferase [Pseudothermotoga sp.]GLI48390.1 SAM-dependent methyltransferase [Pseudothermotoga lettingae TMO]
MKITGGTLKGYHLNPVPDSRTRYTTSLVRQAVFNMIDVSQSSFLELFCGSAVMSIEALSRGAKHAVAVDISSKAIKTAIENAKKCGVELKIVKSDFRKFINLCNDNFDVVFADPPYNLGFVQKLLELLSIKPSLGQIIIIEKAAAEQVVIPEKLKILKSKKYGETEVLVIART